MTHAVLRLPRSEQGLALAFHVGCILVRLVGAGQVHSLTA